jgi:hypothetical protein
MSGGPAYRSHENRRVTRSNRGKEIYEGYTFRYS